MKTILFFILAPFVFIPMVIMTSVYGADTDGKGWYQEVWKSGKHFQIALAVLVSPIVWFAVIWLRLMYPIWDGLL